MATQSVLEGLNACLDHRGEIYVPELDRTFVLDSQNTKIFATQNPSKDGSGRKGLPKSFLNRFVKVFMSELKKSDAIEICRHRFGLGDSAAASGGATNAVWRLHTEVAVRRAFGLVGGPWSFNLRDLLRWCQGMQASAAPDDDSRNYALMRLAKLLFSERFRTAADRSRCMEIIKLEFGCANSNFEQCATFHISPDALTVGCVSLPRHGDSSLAASRDNILLLENQLPVLESLMLCVKNCWIPILVGDACAGKSALVQMAALLAGRKLVTLALNPATDTSELLGTHEQSDKEANFGRILAELREKVVRRIRDGLHLRELFNALNELDDVLARSSQASAAGCDDEAVRDGLKFKIQTVIDVVRARLESKFPDEFNVILCELHALSKIKSSRNSTTFEWRDSALVAAVSAGHWVLIDNANYCSASVLDRLNGLFESGGVLAIGEQGCDRSGGVRTIRPHPEFRVFLTMDPRNGELSPAMRNRCVEIFVDSSEFPLTTRKSLGQVIRAELGSLLGETRCRELLERALDSDSAMNIGDAARFARSFAVELSASNEGDDLGDAFRSCVAPFANKNNRRTNDQCNAALKTDFSLSAANVLDLARSSIVTRVSAQLGIVRHSIAADPDSAKEAFAAFFRVADSDADMGVRSLAVKDLLGLSSDILQRMTGSLVIGPGNLGPQNLMYLYAWLTRDIPPPLGVDSPREVQQLSSQFSIAKEEGLLGHIFANLSKDSLQTDHDSFVRVWLALHAMDFVAKSLATRTCLEEVTTEFVIDWVIAKERIGGIVPSDFGDFASFERAIGGAATILPSREFREAVDASKTFLGCESPETDEVKAHQKKEVILSSATSRITGLEDREAIREKFSGKSDDEFGAGLKLYQVVALDVIASAKNSRLPAELAASPFHSVLLANMARKGGKACLATAAELAMHSLLSPGFAAGFLDVEAPTSSIGGLMAMLHKKPDGAEVESKFNPSMRPISSIEKVIKLSKFLRKNLLSQSGQLRERFICEPTSFGIESRVLELADCHSAVFEKCGDPNLTSASRLNAGDSADLRLVKAALLLFHLTNAAIQGRYSGLS